MRGLICNEENARSRFAAREGFEKFVSMGIMNKLILLLLLSVGTRSVFAQNSEGPVVRDAYSLSWSKDIPLSVISVGSFAFGQWRISNMTGYHGGYDQNNLLPWDKPFAGVYNSKADLASNVLCGAVVLPFVISGYDWHNGSLNGSDVGTQFVMLAQVLALESGINLAVRSVALWPRPLVFHSPLDSSLLTKDVGGSFYSGHASGAFAVAVFTGIWYDHTHPGSEYAPWVWAGALTLATSISALRVAAGKHYPTDVMVGAAVGSLAGWAIPKLHEQSAKSGAPATNLVFAPIPGGAMMQWTF